MNNTDDQLSLGNLFRVIKDLAKNKSSALQSEIFCILFDLESINDTTVNNYCVGCRSIGSQYKQQFINKQNRYYKDKNEFLDNIVGVLSIIDGSVYTNVKDKYSFINESESALELCKKMYNIGKNDKFVTKSFVNKLSNYLQGDMVYECFVEILLFIVLVKRQPLYEDELKKEVLDNVLIDTSISSLDLQEYLSLKLREGINYDYTMMKLADSGNAYANFELGSNEYYGFFTGKPRYDVAFSYLEKAARDDHAGANYMIGNMFISGNLGSMSDGDLELGYSYIEKSYKLGNVAACNTIGKMYLRGIHPLNKDVEKAREYFIKAANNNYAYALNNLGSIEEKEGNLDKAYEYYFKSAELGESWSCNKVGEYYRKNGNYEEAFKFYNRAIMSNCRIVCRYAYYNLAKYYYLNGCGTIVLVADENKAIEYFRESGKIEGLVEILYLYVKKYLKNKDEVMKCKIFEVKEEIEQHEKYNIEIKRIVEKEVLSLQDKEEIQIDVR